MKKEKKLRFIHLEYSYGTAKEVLYGDADSTFIPIEIKEGMGVK